MDNTPYQTNYSKIKRVLKYFIVGWIVALACLAIPIQRMELLEVIMISMIAAIGYGVVDNYIKV